MGLNGSDVAKQSAEIVLSDDNFSTIIEAVRKGRGIFFNLQKFMLYLLSGNLAEVLVMMIDESPDAKAAQARRIERVEAEFKSHLFSDHVDCALTQRNVDRPAQPAEHLQ